MLGRGGVAAGTDFQQECDCFGAHMIFSPFPPIPDTPNRTTRGWKEKTAKDVNMEAAATLPNVVISTKP